MNPEDFLYRYRARVVSVYDGDTVTVDLDLGLGVWLRGQRLRLVGLDTPEIRGPERPEGILVRDWVRERLPDGAEIIVQTQRDRTGKYGRWLARIWVPGEDGWWDLNKALLDSGRASPYLR